MTTTPRTIPPDIATRMAALLARMTARGMTEAIQVWGKTTQYASDGVTPVSRPFALLGTLQGYVAAGGGTVQIGPDGTRQYVADTAYFPPDPTGWLTEGNQAAREIVLPSRSSARRRIRAYQVVGPYAFCVLEEGGLQDTAGKL
jgi:hypothetical protein